MSTGISVSDVLRLDMLAERLNMEAKQTYVGNVGLLPDLAFILVTAITAVEKLPNVVLADIEALLSAFKTDLDALPTATPSTGGSPPPICPAGYVQSNGRCVPGA